MNTVYLQTYFVTLASIFGTGILGLPVTMYNSGFYPFLVVFIIDFVMEALVILIAVEILQKAHAIQVKYNKENQGVLKNNENFQQNSSDKNPETKSGTKCETQSLDSETELLPLKKMSAEGTCDKMEDQSENRDPILTHSEQKDIRSPDLHLLGELFLCYGIRHVFDILSIFKIMTLLIAYSLAGSGAYSEMLGIKYIYMIPVFNWSLAFLLLFAFNLIQHIVSILTTFSASLFTMVVIVTLFVTSEVQENIQNNFNHIQDSFLMSTVALGGSFFIMPFLFRKIENDVSQIKKYRLAVLMGLVTYVILTIFWCWAVLQIVPQHCTPMVGTNQSSHSPITCNSLESANKNGEVSTKPLINIIWHKHPSFFWVAKVVEVFIMISITISYLAIGITLHHIICGIVESISPIFSKYTTETPKIMNISKTCASTFFSLILFGIIFIIAILNPKGFLDVTEKFTSLIINILKILIFMMFMVTRNKENNKVKIPLPLPNMVMPFVFLLPLFFGFAIGYDIYFLVTSYLYYETDKSHVLALQQNLHENSFLLNVMSPLHVNATS